MWAGHPDRFLQVILCGLATLNGFLQVNPVVLAEPEEIGSSRFNPVVLAKPEEIGSSRLILLCWLNQKRLVPPGKRLYPGWAGHPDGFLQVNPVVAG